MIPLGLTKEAIMFQKLLVLMDGSKLAEGILPYVSQLAKGMNASGNCANGKPGITGIAK